MPHSWLFEHEKTFNPRSPFEENRNNWYLLSGSTAPSYLCKALVRVHIDVSDAHYFTDLCQSDGEGYIQAAIDGMIIGCIYPPNGNLQPGPKLTTSSRGLTG